MATYLMQVLLERDSRNYLDNVNFCKMASNSQDGYKHLENGRGVSVGGSSGCVGVDGNRN